MMQDKLDLPSSIRIRHFPARFIMMQGVDPLYPRFRADRCENLG
jgi:hypothetical protein